MRSPLQGRTTTTRFPATHMALVAGFALLCTTNRSAFSQEATSPQHEKTLRIVLGRQPEVPLRAGPEPTAAVIGMLRSGDSVRVTEIRSSQLRTKHGWVDAEATVTVAEAIPFFSAGIAREPTVHALMNRAIAYQDAFDFRSAFADYSHATRIDPNNAKALSLRGMTRFHLGETKEALSDLDAAVKLAPEFSRAHAYRGLVLGGLGRLAEAVEELDLAIEIEPHIEAYIGRAQIRELNNDQDGALEDISSAIKLNPEEPTARLVRCNMYITIRKFDKAEEDARSVLRENPNNFIANENMAHLHAAKRELDQALVYVEKAIQVAPHRARAFQIRAQVWEALDKPAKAVDDWNSAIEREPHVAVNYVRRGALLMRIPERPIIDSVNDFERAIALNPNSHEAWNRKAWLHANSKNAEVRDDAKAIEAATRACELTNWKNSDYVGILAIAYANGGKFEKAIEAQETTLALAPDSRKPRERELLALFRNGEKYPSPLSK